MFTKQQAKEIFQDFTVCMHLSSVASVEIDAALEGLSDRERLCLMSLYTVMSVTDRMTIPVSTCVDWVKQTLKTYDALPYCKEIPFDIFKSYVLPTRVNDESFENERGEFYQELAPLISSSDIKNAALAVNYWCMSKVTYRGTDDRTLGPLTLSKIGFGRCGEESVFAVAALRSVGIPARQCYCPHWAHCDDNHAWVEVYTLDGWHCMGACEAEEYLDIGWFNHAATKAPVTSHRQLGKQSVSRDFGNALYTVVPTTQAYGDTQTLEVVAGSDCLLVEVYIINYGRPARIAARVTDVQGHAHFTLGIGSYIVYCRDMENYDMQVVDLRVHTSITLKLKHRPQRISFELVPPKGKLVQLPQSTSIDHMSRVYACQKTRELQRFTPSTTVPSDLAKLLSPKDLYDITQEVVDDALLAYEYKERFSPEVFGKYVLCPRVQNEPLYPHRGFMKNYFKDKDCDTPQKVYSWLLLNCKTCASLSYPGVAGDPVAAIKHRTVTEYTLPLLFVAISRALGMAARLNPHHHHPEYYTEQGFVSLFANDDPTSVIHISHILGEGQLSLFKMDDSLKCLDMDLSGQQINLPRGEYGVVNSMRQIDGSVLGYIQINTINEKRSATVGFNRILDRTLEKLMGHQVPDLEFEGGATLYSKLSGRDILAFVQIGTEPTEHFLNELLEKNQKDTGVIIVAPPSSVPNPTLAQVLEAGLATLHYAKHEVYIEQLRGSMGVGDRRLPLIVAVRERVALYAFANYNVGTVDLLYGILA